MKTNNRVSRDIAQNIRIVMVETTHPGNIGAAARAMKTMGQRRLFLVNPKVFPSAEVTARAAGADDILSRATVCESLTEAIRDCVLVVATTARVRSIPWPVMEPREGASQIVQLASKGEVALVFGRESSGLKNEEIEICNAVMQIPTDPVFRSLNIASAIQIICYEILQTIGNSSLPDSKAGVPLASSEEMARFYEHLETTLIDIGFHDPEKPRRLMRRLKRLFNRAVMDENEINIMRGILTAIQKAAGKINSRED